jgi:hypothetical protein
MNEKENRRITDNIFKNYVDSFYAECRAYIRIREEKRNKKRKRDIAVLYYDFLNIPGEREKKFYRKFDVEA